MNTEQLDQEPRVRKCVAIYSGGLDSTVLLYHLKSLGYQPYALSVDYGQRHSKELNYARDLARYQSIPHQVADLSGISHLLGGSSQTDDSIPVPHGHYEDETMKVTVVPNRNMIMLSIAMGWAVSIGADTVAFGAHGGDHAIYPDCRERFVSAMNEVGRVANYDPILVTAPFVGLTKAGIVEMGAELGVPFEMTWSCYEGGTFHCGKCGTCQERIEAFQIAGVPDPTIYLEDPS